MSFEAKVILDAIAPSGYRLMTFQLTYPRFIHSELMTHRLFSRNASSSRAIPIEKMISRIQEDTAMPIHWGQNQRGMQAGAEIAEVSRGSALGIWIAARDDMIFRAKELIALGCHKQVVNRLLEPFSHMVTIVTATDYINFFAQRCSKEAQPEFRHLAMMMAEQYYDVSRPKPYHTDQWYLPYIQPDEQNLPENVKRSISVARCARVSYLSQEGVRDIKEDLKLFDRLLGGDHWSPFEHVARACSEDKWFGNFCGWRQYRKSFASECATRFSWGRVKQAFAWASVPDPCEPPEK